MTKRTKPRHYQSHSDREIRRSSPGTTTTHDRVRKGGRGTHSPPPPCCRSLYLSWQASCVRMSEWSSNSIWQPLFVLKFIFARKGKPEKAVLPPDVFSVLNPVRSGWNTGCIPRSPIWVMNSIIVLLLATSQFGMNGLLDMEVPLCIISFIHPFLYSVSHKC